MPKRLTTRLMLAAAIAAAATAPGLAADVTSQRLQNTAAEPQNWLMIHRDYDNSRHSPLKDINRDTVKNLQLKFMFSTGGRSTGGTLRGKEESTPLVDDGFMYVTDTWSRVMKFDVRSGTAAVPLWRYDPKITRSRTTRGLAMYGNKVFLSTYDARLIALNRDSGEVAWEVQASAPMDPKTGTPSKTQAFSGAPLAVRTAGGRELVVQGESTGGSQGTRSWVGAFEADTGKLAWRTFTIPAPGEPGSETWKDNHNAWRIGGASVWQTPSYDPRPTCSITAPATRSRLSIRNTAPATISTPRAPSRWMPTPARWCGSSRKRPTSIGTSTRRARRCSTRSR